MIAWIEDGCTKPPTFRRGDVAERDPEERQDRCAGGPARSCSAFRLDPNIEDINGCFVDTILWKCAAVTQQDWLLRVGQVLKWFVDAIALSNHRRLPHYAVSTAPASSEIVNNLASPQPLADEYLSRMAHPIYAARTPAEFRRLSEEHGGLQLVTTLEKGELTSSASRWTFRHLLGFRLLTIPEESFLEVFMADHKIHCPVCDSERPCPQKLDHQWTSILTSGFPINLLKSSDSELLRLQGAFFWVALARASRTEVTTEARVYPQRDRRPPHREGYIDSTVAILGSSSPAGPSSSEFEVDLDDIDDDAVKSHRRRLPYGSIVETQTSIDVLL